MGESGKDAKLAAAREARKRKRHEDNPRSSGGCLVATPPSPNIWGSVAKRQHPERRPAAAEG